MRSLGAAKLMRMPDRHEADLVPSPGGWEHEPNEMQCAPERMPRWVRVWSRIPFLDRSAHRWMWSHGGYLVLPPDHPLLGRYGPEEYEALTGITRAEYERRCVGAARTAFAEDRRFADAEVTIDGDDLVVRFSVAGRAEGFGSRAELWPAPHPDDYEGEPEWSELLPTFVQAALDSQYRVLSDPDDDGVIWI